jgi:hypothetical protein
MTIAVIVRLVDVVVLGLTTGKACTTIDGVDVVCKDKIRIRTRHGVIPPTAASRCILLLLFVLLIRSPNSNIVGWDSERNVDKNDVHPTASKALSLSLFVVLLAFTCFVEKGFVSLS